MTKINLPPGWVHRAYRFEVDRPSRHPAIPSHEGAKRFAWNWALGVVEEQLQAKEALRVLALRQGARMVEAEDFATRAATIPALVELNEQRRKDHEARVQAGKRNGPYHPVSEWCPWSAEAMRFIWNRTKDAVATWWAENSKEAYSSAFEALASAFMNYFGSLSGKRKGLRVGWPRHKARRGRQSVSFTTGAVKILDHHHVQLPVIGRLRVKEPTDKLRLRIEAGTARVLRATLVSEGGKTYVSFAVIATRAALRHAPVSVAGHDVGISALVTASDGHVVENPRAEARAHKQISRYLRKMDRQHRGGSPACFGPDGTHIKGACHWKTRSKRSRENQARLARTHAKAARMRRDAIHKATHRASTRFAANVVEDLNVAGLGQEGRGKRGFNRAAKDAALAEYRRQLSYKCPWYGSVLWLANRWYPSSKMCSACRTKKSNLPRSARVFHCDACGLTMDRDLNAAKNLAALAELASVCLMAQIATGVPVDWSKLPVRPDGWEEDQDTRSSRGCARAGGRKADGGGRKTARASTGGDHPLEREAASHRPLLLAVARQSEVA